MEGVQQRELVLRHHGPAAPTYKPSNYHQVLVGIPSPSRSKPLVPSTGFAVVAISLGQATLAGSDLRHMPASKTDDRIQHFDVCSLFLFFERSYFYPGSYYMSLSFHVFRFVLTYVRYVRPLVLLDFCQLC